MKIAVFYRENRNIEFQKKISNEPIHDDAYDEARMHAAGLTEAGYDVELIKWNNNPLKMYELIKEKSITIVFNVSSYDEIIFLETFKIPYVGSSSKIVGTDKVQRKILCSYYGINTPKFQIANSINDIPKITLNYPLFVKPLNGRGSSGIDDSNIIESYEQLLPVVKRITQEMNQAALIEEYIQGKEVTVGVIGYANIEVLPILEIEFTNGKTNSFEHKMKDLEIITCPAKLDELTTQRINKMVKDVYKVLDIKDFGRVDIMLDKNNTPYFLEVNTFAGLNLPQIDDKSAHVGYMGYMAIKAGYNRPKFLDKILLSAFTRYGLTINQ
jgi:D-alanine-D-alanine ligase